MIAVNLHRRRIFGGGTCKEIFASYNKLWKKYHLLETYDPALINVLRGGQEFLTAAEGWTLEQDSGQKLRGNKVDWVIFDELVTDDDIFSSERSPI